MLKNQTNPKIKKKRKFVVIILVAVLVAVGVLVAYTAYSGCGNSAYSNTASPSKLTDNGQSIQGQATSESTQQLLDDLKKKEVYVTDSIGSCITFSGKAGDNAAWKVQNLPDNTVIEQVEIYYSNELIGKTTPIYPNQHIDSIQINKNFTAGNYDAMAYINYYNSDTKDLIGKTAYKIKIQVD